MFESLKNCLTECRRMLKVAGGEKSCGLSSKRHLSLNLVETSMVCKRLWARSAGLGIGLLLVVSTVLYSATKDSSPGDVLKTSSHFLLVELRKAPSQEANRVRFGDPELESFLESRELTSRSFLYQGCSGDEALGRTMAELSVSRSNFDFCRYLVLGFSRTVAEHDLLALANNFPSVVRVERSKLEVSKMVERARPAYQPGILIIKLAPDFGECLGPQHVDGCESLEAMIESLQVSRSSPIFAENRFARTSKARQKYHEMGMSRYYQLRVSIALDIEALAASLRDSGLFESVKPSYLLTAD